MTVKQIFNTSAELDYPTVLPTLDLDFANSKTLDPRITFTRASGGSYVGADGLIKYAGVNEPRFDHDPYTGESLGFLVEEARTNLITYSQQFDNAAWVRQTNTTVTANTHVAPDGTTTADTINAISNQIIGNAAVTASTTYTVSVFIRKTTGATIFPMLAVNGFSSDQQRVLNTNTGQLVVRGAALNTGIQCESVGSYWRVSYSGNVGANTTLGFLIYPAASTDGSSYIGGLAGSIIAWGAQVEAGAFPTSYIPTEGSSRTRAADNAQITGTNFSSWYNQSEGSFLLHENNSFGIVLAKRFELNQNSSPNSNAIAFGVNYGNGTRIFSRDSNTTGTIDRTLFNVWSLGGSHKYGYGLRLNDFVVASGTSIATDTAGTFPPNLDSLSFGAINRAASLTNTAGSFRLSRLTYYPKRLTDAQLQVLTS